MHILLIIAAVLAALYLIVSATYHHIHMMQQNGYRIDRYWDWYRTRCAKELRFGELLLLIPMALSFIGQLALAISLIAVLLLLLICYFPRPAQDKKPLVLTPRARRLYLLTAVIAVLIVAAIWLLPADWLRALAVLIACLLSRFYMLLASLLLAPVEKAINNGYLRDAAQKIAAMPGLTKIGITGSYGKTSTKLIMAGVLGEKYQTLATPASYNTPMGITRTIREMLSPVDEVFVCEMGAKQKGDIDELCQLVHPTIGVLTSIGEQHLETFGNIANIIDTKFELIESLPADGLAVVNGDNPYIAANLNRAPCRVIRYGLQPDNDYWADQISYGAKGVSFVLHHQQVAAPFSSSLLGAHMVSNILAALAVADQLGVSLRQLQRAVKALPPIEHRLQLRPAGDYFIIDDAFNSNPAGAAAALEVLAAFGAGKKIIITPGMVELGEKEYQLNFELGRQMAQVCDYIILVGKKHSKPLFDGVTAAGYPSAQLFVASDLNEARSRLAQVVEPEAVVLFENDLPDTYNE